MASRSGGVTTWCFLLRRYSDYWQKWPPDPEGLRPLMVASCTYRHLRGQKWPPDPEGLRHPSFNMVSPLELEAEMASRSGGVTTSQSFRRCQICKPGRNGLQIRRGYDSRNLRSKIRLRSGRNGLQIRRGYDLYFSNLTGSLQRGRNGLQIRRGYDMLPIIFRQSLYPGRNGLQIWRGYDRKSVNTAEAFA